MQVLEDSNMAPEPVAIAPVLPPAGLFVLISAVLFPQHPADFRVVCPLFGMVFDFAATKTAFREFALMTIKQHAAKKPQSQV